MNSGTSSDIVMVVLPRPLSADTFIDSQFCLLYCQRKKCHVAVSTITFCHFSQALREACKVGSLFVSGALKVEALFRATICMHFFFFFLTDGTFLSSSSCFFCRQL